MARYDLRFSKVFYDDVTGELTVTLDGGDPVSPPPPALEGADYFPLGPPMEVEFVSKVKKKQLTAARAVVTTTNRDGSVTYTLWERDPGGEWQAVGPADHRGQLLDNTHRTDRETPNDLPPSPRMGRGR